MARQTKQAGRKPSSASGSGGDQKAAGRAPAPAPKSPTPATPMDGRIPGLTDAELKTLAANAERLAATGDDRRKAEAERLLPLIRTEADARATAKAAAKAKALEARRKPARRAASPAPADENG